MRIDYSNLHVSTASAVWKNGGTLIARGRLRFRGSVHKLRYAIYLYKFEGLCEALAHVPREKMEVEKIEGKDVPNI